MTLSATLATAGQSLTRAALQSGMIARNIAGADQPGYARRSIAMGAAEIARDTRPVIARAINDQLRNGLRTALADKARQEVLSTKVDLLDAAVNSGQTPGVLEAATARLKTSLQAFAEDPAQPAFATEAVEAARGLAKTFNEVSSAIVEARRVADREIQDAVRGVNERLERLANINASIVRAQSGESADLQDARDQILDELSGEIGIRILQRPDRTIGLIADNGAVLLDREAHFLTFTARETFLPSTDGAAIFVDGVDATSAISTMRLGSGRLAGLAAWRDDELAMFQTKIDDAANNLIEAFSESSRTSAPPGMKRPGLFVASSDAVIPEGATRGLAAAIRLNPRADPALDGNSFGLRDGGIAASGTDYVSNLSGDPSFHDRLHELLNRFSLSSGGGPGIDQVTAAFSANLRTAGTQASADLQRDAFQTASLTDALRSSVGVDLDRQMEQMLSIEHSYQASAKLLATTDSLLQDLIRMLD